MAALLDPLELLGAPPHLAAPPGVQESPWCPDADGRPSLLTPSLRRRIIDLLAGQPLDPDGRGHGLSAPHVAVALGVHVTTARAHLEALAEAHVVEPGTQRSGQVGRPRKLYRLVAPSVRLHPITRELSRLVTTTWRLPEPEGSTAMEPAARDWALRHADVVPPPWAPADTPGQWLATAELLVEQLEGWGFRHDVTLVDGGEQVDLTLRAAPFLAIAAHHAPVLYAFRRGLLRGVLVRLGETDVDVTLTPHEDIAVTTAHLRTATPFRHTVRVAEAPPAPVSRTSAPVATTSSIARRRTTNRRRDA